MSIKVTRSEAGNGRFEDLVYNKILNKETLDENDLSTLVNEFDVDVIEGENRRWQRGMTTIVELSGKFFSIDWDEGLTENQENDYGEQPVEVERKEELVKVAKWQEVTKMDRDRKTEIAADYNF